MTREELVLLNKDVVVWNWELDETLNNTNLTASIVKSFESLGFKLKSKVLENLLHEKNIELFYKNTFKKLSEFKGNNVNHIVFYKNFPKVPNVRDQYIHALLHYIFGVLPEDYGAENYEERIPLYESVDLTELDILSSLESEYILKEYFTDCLKSKTSWSEGQKDSIKELYSKYNFEIDNTPVNKENMCWLVANTNVDPKDILKTSTDVLRYITAVSEGDITLATNCKFKKFKRSDRRRLLSIMDNLNQKAAAEDMVKYRERWLRIGEILHPGEYSNQFPNAAKLFKDLRESTDIATFNRTLEKLISERKFVDAAEHLKKRPGEFARRLDKLVRDCKITEVSKVLNYFSDVAEKVSISVLLQLRSHFISRKEKSSERIFILKGVRTRVKAIENTLEPLPEIIVDAVVNVIMKAIEKIISTREFLTPEDRVYIEPKMYNIAIPENNMRGASDGKKLLTKGSKMFIDGDAKCLRFFTHWKNIQNNDHYTKRVDIDIAAQLFDENWKFIDEVSWRSRYSNVLEVTFSGDITDAPRGATEYIDIDTESLYENKNIKYIVITNNIYTCQTYNLIPECFSGVMFREKPSSGEIFEPSTVISRADLTCEGSGQMVAFVYDIDEKSLVWIDSNLERFARVAGDNSNLIANTVSKVINKQSLTVGDIYEIYARTHNILTDDIEKATFVVGRDVSEYDVEVFSTML